MSNNNNNHNTSNTINSNNNIDTSRTCQVVLLDGRKLDFIIQPKLNTLDLIDLVASHFNLKEKEYFGLSYIDQTGHRCWLQTDKKVLDHEFAKKSGQLILHFTIKFFIENVSYLRDTITAELYYLQAQLLIFKNELEIQHEKLFELASLVLQATFGDYVSDQVTRNNFKKISIIATNFYEKEQLKATFVEERVINNYKKLNSMTRGQCIVNFMAIVEHLPNYGVHFYEVKDKSNISWYLGISFKGIAVYEYNDRKAPRKTFPWRQLENLYYRERKFSIEVHESKRHHLNSHHQSQHQNSSSSTTTNTRRSQSVNSCLINNNNNNNTSQQQQPSPPSTQSGSTSKQQLSTAQQQNQVKVHAWFASVPSLCKTIWLMAVAQHQFYLDRKQSKANMLKFKSLTDLANELNTSSLIQQPQQQTQVTTTTNDVQSDGGFVLSRANSMSSQELLEQSRLAKQEMWQLYKTRKENLEKLLAQKKEELKGICVKEAEVTGKLPKEYPLEKGEELPVIRRKIGASYQFNQIDKTSTSNLNNSTTSNTTTNNQYDEKLFTQLNVDFEIQSKITNAALILASDPSATKAIRKQRRDFYEKARDKLAKIEKRLNEQKVLKFTQHLNTPPVRNQHQHTPPIKSVTIANMNNNVHFSINSVDDESNLVELNPLSPKSTPTSPVMIHRKESYRRAQQQKLALSKAANNVAANLSESNLALFHHSNASPTSKQQTSGSTISIPLVIHARNNHISNSTGSNLNQLNRRVEAKSPKPYIQQQQQQFGNLDEEQLDDQQNSYVNLLYGSTNGNSVLPFNASELNILNNTTKSSHKKRDISLNRFVSLDETSYSNLSNGMAQNGVNTNNRNDENALLNNTSPNIISSNITIRGGSRNNQQAATATGTGYQHRSSQQHLNKNNTNTSTQPPPVAAAAAAATVLLSNSSLERKQRQKKNTTSDSNVKLLADHNFYHVTNRGVPPPPPPPVISSSSSTSSSLSNKAASMLINERNEELFKNILFNNNAPPTPTTVTEVSKPYELADFYKYSTRYRNSHSSNGSNSNTNTLLMINTAVNNNNYENNEHVFNKMHSTPNDLAGGGQQMLNNNNKYRSANLNTPPSNSSSSLYDSIQYQMQAGLSPKCFQLHSNNSMNDHSTTNTGGGGGGTLATSTSASNLSTTTNSISLNLSIHTAEEFGKEMLAWLQSEHKQRNPNSLSSSNLAAAAATGPPPHLHHIHITNTSGPNGDSTSTAATLV